MTASLDPIDRLRAIMARLRDPVSGCEWDLAQTFATIAPYTIEEAYEVADAIARDDLAALREELGDLLLQVVFHSRIAEEAGAFGFDDVATAISEKMESRHPHNFRQRRRRRTIARGTLGNPQGRRTRSEGRSERNGRGCPRPPRANAGGEIAEAGGACRVRLA